MDIINGSVSVTTYFTLRDATTHAPKADVTVTDIDVYYLEQGAAMAAKADITALDAADSAYAANKGFHCGLGLYRIDWPDAAFDGGIGKRVYLIVVCAGVDTEFREVHLVTDTTTDSLLSQFDDTGFSSAVVDANIVEVNGEEITALDAAIDANLTQVMGTALSQTDAGYLAAALSKLLDVATPTKTVNDIGGSGASVEAIRTEMDDNSTKFASLLANSERVDALIEDDDGDRWSEKSLEAVSWEGIAETGFDSSLIAWNEPLTESFPAIGATPTAAQMMWMMFGGILHREIDGGTLSILDSTGAVQATFTISFNEAGYPTKMTRAT